MWGRNKKNVSVLRKQYTWYLRCILMYHTYMWYILVKDAWSCRTLTEAAQIIYYEKVVQTRQKAWITESHAANSMWVASERVLLVNMPFTIQQESPPGHQWMSQIRREEYEHTIGIQWVWGKVCVTVTAQPNTLQTRQSSTSLHLWKDGNFVAAKSSTRKENRWRSNVQSSKNRSRQTKLQ